MLSIDGVEQARLDGRDTLPIDGYSDVHVGVYVSGMQHGPVEILIDEVVVDDAPVPCDP